MSLMNSTNATVMASASKVELFSGFTNYQGGRPAPPSPARGWPIWGAVGVSRLRLFFAGNQHTEGRQICLPSLQEAADHVASSSAMKHWRFRHEVVSRRQLRTIQDRAGPQPAAGKAWPDGPRLFLGDVRRLPVRPHGSVRASFARSGETFFAFGFLLQFEPSFRHLPQHGSMFFRHRHCQTLTFLRESPVPCGVTHRCCPPPQRGRV